MKRLLLIVLLVSLLLAPSAVRAEGKLVCLGDSIARGYGLDDPESERFSRLAADELGLYESNWGVDGQMALETLDELEADESRAAGADIVLLSIGANHALPAMMRLYTEGKDPDMELRLASFQAELDRLLDKILLLAPEARVVLLTFYNPYAGWGGSFSAGCEEICASFNGVIRDCAEAHGCLTADVYAAFDEAGDACLLENDIHPSAKGHEIIASCVLDALTEESPHDG